MIFIAHRGNLTGRTPRENEPSYIEEALLSGYDVEIDVWFHLGKFWLGHDAPVYEVADEFLENSRLWCHAKNEQALWHMDHSNINFFWHETDRFTLTSKGFVWTADATTKLSNAIVMLPNIVMLTSWQKILWNSNIVFGICSDIAP